ncbi:unnamed protein product, partial [marine sediment metagenome]
EVGESDNWFDIEISEDKITEKSFISSTIDGDTITWFIILRSDDRYSQVYWKKR